MKKLDLRKLSWEVKKQLCELALEKHKANESIAHISRAMGIHRVTISKWVKNTQSVKYVNLDRIEKRKDTCLNKYDRRSKSLIYKSSLKHISSFFTKSLPQKLYLWSVNNAHVHNMAFYLYLRHFKIKRTRYVVKKILNEIFEFQPLNNYSNYFYYRYPCTGKQNLYDYCKANSYRCYYLYEAKVKICNNENSKTILVISSPRGDTRFIRYSFNDLFERLIHSAKKQIILIYSNKSLFSQEDISEFSKTHPQISLVCTDDAML